MLSDLKWSAELRMRKISLFTKQYWELLSSSVRFRLIQTRPTPPHTTPTDHTPFPFKIWASSCVRKFHLLSWFWFGVIFSLYLSCMYTHTQRHIHSTFPFYTTHLKGFFYIACSIQCFVHFLIIRLDDSRHCKSTPFYLFYPFLGSIMDTGGEHTLSKHSDISTFKSTLLATIDAHYPAIQGHVAVRLVPCPAICSEALALLAR